MEQFATDSSGLRIALIHDWLTGMRGGEKVLEVLCRLFPRATLYTLLHNKGTISSVIEQMTMRTSFLQFMPWKKTKYRHYLPLMPLAMECMDFTKYDLLISTSHAVAKNANPNDTALHICYCHTPMRYIWDQYEDYFGKGRSGTMTRVAMGALTPMLRWWDVRTSSRVHYFIANSKNVAERIQRIYKRNADVIYPPVDTSKFSLSLKDDGYYLIVSALVPYKKVDIAIEAFNRTGERLLIVGSGPEAKRLQSMARPNIEFLGWQDDKELARCYGGCKALIFPGVEDFGIVPLEAMASGKPVIAYGKGGALETVVAEGDFPTGLFFYKQTPTAIQEALTVFSKKEFDPHAIRRHAEKFDIQLFTKRIKEYIESKVALYFGKN